MRIHFFTNGIFSTSIAGGDIHFLKLAEGAVRAGYELNFFGGHALQEVIRKHQIPGTVTLTDDAMMPKTNTGMLGGQIKLFRDMYARYRRTMSVLDTISPEDLELFMVTDDIEEAVDFITHNTIVPFGLKRIKKSKWLWE